MPGITDPAEEYFKDGLWAWDPAAEAWLKLVIDPSTNKLTVEVGDDFEVHQAAPADMCVGLHAWNTATETWQELYVTPDKHYLLVSVMGDADVKQTTPADLTPGVCGWDGNVWRKLIADTAGLLKTKIAAQDIDVEVKQTAAADLTPGACGWDGAAWRKMPLVFGYSAQYAEREVATNVDAGAVTMTFSTVPAGEVWVIEHIASYAQQASATSCYIYAVVGGVSILLQYHANPGAYRSTEVTSRVTLKTGDYLVVTWYSAAANDDFVAAALGYKMKIAE